MNINKKYLYMKLHYFFIFAGSAPLVPLLPVYLVNNLGLSYTGLGFIYTLLPFLNLIAKAVSGLLSDLCNAHRTTFLASVIVTTLGYFSIYFMQPMPMNVNPQLANIQFDCHHISYIYYDFPDHKCGNNKDFVSDGIATCEIVCSAKPEVVKYLCRSWNITLDNCLTDELKFSASSNISQAEIEWNATFFPVQNIAYLDIEVVHPSCQDLTHLNCTARCDREALMAYFGAPLQIPMTTYSDILSSYQFWIFCLCVIIASSGFSVIVVMSDIICFQLLGYAHAMSLVIAVFGVRFILYYTVVNPWLFLPIEILNGFTVGIFFSVMTSYANIMSPPGAHATIQGIVGASYGGLGVAIGAFVGAALFASVSEASAFLYIGIFNTVFAGIHLGVQLLLNKFNPQREQGHPICDDGYVPPSEIPTPHETHAEVLRPS